MKKIIITFMLFSFSKAESKKPFLQFCGKIYNESVGDSFRYQYI